MSLENEIFEHLKNAKTMQLATVNDSKPWICTVYFVPHEGKLYWLSLPSRRHSQELANDNHAAIAIAIKTDKPVIGVQTEGMVEVVSGKDIVQVVCDLYANKYDQAHDFYENFAAGTNQHNLYCFTPKTWVLFDEHNHPDTPRQEVKV